MRNYNYYLLLLVLPVSGIFGQNIQFSCTGSGCENSQVNATTCVNGNCTNPFVSSILNCPVGYELRGNSCFPKNINCTPTKLPCYVLNPPTPTPIVTPPIPPTFSCPENLQWNGFACVKEIVSEAICPPNFIYTNGQCEHIISGSCPTGYKLVNAQCISTIELNMQCPIGYYLEDGQCVRKIPQPQCPTGFTLINGTCQQIVEAICVTGKKPLDGKCVQESYSDVYCPYPYLWNGNQCIAHSVKVCADGYNYIDGRCVQEIQSNPTIKCEDGYNLLGDLCYPIQNITTSPPEIICPPDVWCPSIPPIVVPEIPTTTEIGESVEAPTTIVPPPIYPPPISPIQPPIVISPTPPCQPIPPSTCPPGGNCTYQPPVVCPGQPPSTCYPPLPGYPTGPCSPITNLPCQTGSCGNQCGSFPSPHNTIPSNVNNQITITNNVNNNHTINVPTNISTNNTNTIHIYTNGRNKCGSVLTITGNETRNESIGGENCAGDEFGEEQIESGSTPSPPCCEVHSPRQCKKEGDEWHCYHRKYNRCGDFCTRPKIYLKRRQYYYREPILIMPPVLLRRRRPNYGSLDCSGCIDGSYGCSGGCYSSECSRLDRSCSYYEQSEFCSEYGGEGCSPDDGNVPEQDIETSK